MHSTDLKATADGGDLIAEESAQTDEALDGRRGRRDLVANRDLRVAHHGGEEDRRRSLMAEEEVIQKVDRHLR